MSAYGDNDGFQAWLDSMGLKLPADADLTVLRQIGSSYVDAAYEHRLTCSRRTGGFNQDLAWPRTGHTVNGQSVPSDLIPQAWVNASYRAAYLQGTNPDWATGTSDPGRITKREKVDVIEREFFSSQDAPGSDVAQGMVADAVINGMVGVWLCPTGRNMNSLFRVI